MINSHISRCWIKTLFLAKIDILLSLRRLSSLSIVKTLCCICLVFAVSELAFNVFGKLASEVGHGFLGLLKSPARYEPAGAANQIQQILSAELCN